MVQIVLDSVVSEKEETDDSADSDCFSCFTARGSE